MELKVSQIGNSLGVILPKEVITQLRVEKGDALWLVEGPNGYHLTPYNTELSSQMEAAREIMKRRRQVLHELSK
jgi:putative addiction module antidote